MKNRKSQNCVVCGSHRRTITIEEHSLCNYCDAKTEEIPVFFETNNSK